MSSLSLSSDEVKDWENRGLKTYDFYDDVMYSYLGVGFAFDDLEVKGICLYKAVIERVEHKAVNVVGEIQLSAIVDQIIIIEKESLNL